MTPTATLTPTPTPGLSTGANPASRSVVPGDVASFTVTVSNLGGLPDSVALGATGPGLASTSFNPATFPSLAPAASATSALQLGVASSATPGSIPVAVSATGSSGAQASASVTVNVVNPTATFSRTLSGDRVGQHKAPPVSAVTMQVSATISADVSRVTLVDHFPSGWGVTDPGGGTVTLGAPDNTVRWDFGPSAAGSTLTATYVLFSPSLESPPAKYDFIAEVLWPGSATVDAPYQVIVSDPTSTVEYLHAAEVTLNGRTFNTVSTAAVAGTLAELSATPGDEGTLATFADSQGHSIFVSDPVPAGQQWDLGGAAWSATIYLRASTSRWVLSRVLSIYRVDPFGNATRIYRGINSSGFSLGTSYTASTWSTSTVPAGTIIGPGDRFGVEFAISLSGNATVYLGYDASAQNSRVTAQITTAAAAPVVKEAHFRIGQDTPLGSMAWYAETDAQTPGILRNTSFRVRFQVYNSGASSKVWTPRLEWADVSSGAFAAVPTSAGTSPFYVAATGQYANGATVQTSTFGLGPGIGTAQAGVAYDTQNPGASFTLNAQSYTEIEFNLQATSNATFYSIYLFRLTDNGTPLSSYNSDAQLSVWEQQSTASPHVITGSTPDNCAACHRSHTAQGVELRRFFNDKQTCMTCHDGTGSTQNLSTEFNTYTYRHPIEATSGIHNAGEGYSASWNVGANRHVTCMDCHNPHAARTGASTPGFGDTPNTIAGQWGVSPTNPTTAWSPLAGGDYTRVRPVAREYQLCLKCHSSYGYGTSAPVSHSGGITETDQAKEFNVNNSSYHWVESDKTAAAGYTPRTADPARVMTFTTGTGLTPSTKLNCTDCHASSVASDPRGPHGSSVPYLLRGTWGPGQQDLCLRCHDPNTYSANADPNDPTIKTGFSGEKPNLHAFHMRKTWEVRNGCQTCHSAVPHGGQYRALLAPRRLPDGTQPPADSYNANSKLWLNSWASSGSWAQPNCGIYPGGGH